MGLPSITSGQLRMDQSQAQWDAIAAIKANSPFAEQEGSSSSSGVGNALDAILSGYQQQTDAIAASTGMTDGASAGSGASAADETLAMVTARVRAAQQSTIDLFA
jgi:hypothetical protein